jgi:hypothetical protein
MKKILHLLQFWANLTRFNTKAIHFPICSVWDSHRDSFVYKLLIRKVLFVACFMLVSFSTLKMEMSCSSETSVDFRRTTGCYIAEHGNMQHCVSVWFADDFSTLN